MSKIKNFTVGHCTRSDVRGIIESLHYSRSINGVISCYCFKLLHEDRVIGGIIFGSLGMANSWKKYGASPDKVTELRRLVCIDDTPKNTESFFIGKCLRWLELNTQIETVVSYADPNYGHSGVIYKASNFKLMGLTSPGRVIMWGDKKYHDKCIRTYHNGRLKPFAQRVKDALDRGDAYYKKQVGKNIFTYQLKRKLRRI